MDYLRLNWCDKLSFCVNAHNSKGKYLTKRLGGEQVS